MQITWFVRFFFLATLVGAVLFLGFNGIPKGQSKLYIHAFFLVFVFLWFGAEAWLNRRRISQLQSRLEFLGFVPRASSDIHYEPHERHRNFEFTINVQADWNGVPIRVSEFSFQQGSGKSKVTHRYIQVAAAAADVPDFQLQPAGFLATQNLSEIKILPASSKSLAAQFSRRWTIIWPHSDEAHEHFPEPLLEWLIDAPRYESWTCVKGDLSCSWKRGCTPDQVEQLLARLATFLRLYRE